MEDIERLTDFALENSDSGIVITDVGGTILYANKRQCEMSGFKKTELLNYNARIFQSGKTPLAIYQRMWSTILSGETWRGELLNKRRNGELYRELVHISPAKDRDGTALYFLAIKTERYQSDSAEPSANDIPAFDPLTGLLNRSSFLHSLDKVIYEQQTRLKKSGITVYYVDIDRFDAVNKGFGHPAGDLVLTTTTKILNECLRQNNSVARVGADVFAAFLLEEPETAKGETTPEKILCGIRESMSIDGQQLFVTASIGGVRYPENGRNAEELLTKARTAMKIAKGEGGDAFHPIDETTHPVENERNSLLSELRYGIERQQLVLHYQPQINVFTGEIAGLEALIRWFRTPGEMVPPNDFIPVAEKSDLIISIGEWVLQQAVSQIKAWHEQGLPWLKVAVNLSASHFHRRELPAYVEKVIGRSGVPPQFLELELTESAMLQNPFRVRENIALLKNIGVQISLDDFGTGQSSLVWLSKLPVDQLKIDRSFISDVTVNPVNASIVTATIAMAQKLDKDSIAEGIETEAQLNFIRRHGCDFMQGFLFSKPLPVDDITTMLRENRKWSFKGSSQEKQNFTLLLVDDEPAIIKLLKINFRREGYTILAAKNAEEALTILAENEVEIVISDHRMPGMTGVELLTIIKKLYPETVRIILSGYADVPSIIDAINQGAIWKYFTKPLEIEIIRKAVRKACQQILIQKNSTGEESDRSPG